MPAVLGSALEVRNEKADKKWTIKFLLVASVMASPPTLSPASFSESWRLREAELLAALRIVAVPPPRDDPQLLAALEAACATQLLALRRSAVDFVLQALAQRDAAAAERDAARADALRLEGALRGTRARLVEASAAARGVRPSPPVKPRASSAGAAALRTVAVEVPHTPRRVAILEAAAPLARLRQAPGWALDAPPARAWSSSLRAELGSSPARPSFQLPPGSRSFT